MVYYYNLFTQGDLFPQAVANLIDCQINEDSFTSQEVNRISHGAEIKNNLFTYSHYSRHNIKFIFCTLN